MPRIPNQYRAERLSIIKTMQKWWNFFEPKLPPASQSRKKFIIFDLDGVLCTTDIWKASQIIGWKTIFAYIFDQWKLPQEKFLYQALSSARAKSKHRSFATHHQILPAIMVDWQCNLQPHQIIKTIMIDQVVSSQYSSAQKNFLLKIINLTMNPEKLIITRRTIPAGIKLLHELKNLGYQIYILSNWDLQSFPLLKKQFPEIFVHNGKKMFDGIITSGQAHAAKPFHTIYEKALTEFNIDPQQTIFIDDVIENVHAAKKMQIQSIHYNKNNITQVKMNLNKLLK